MIINSRILLLVALLTPAVALSQGAISRSAMATGRTPPTAIDLEAAPGCAQVGKLAGTRSTAAPAAPAFLPVQLEIHTPVEPTMFPSGGHKYLIYELHLRNFAGEPLDLQGVEVIDDGQAEVPLATFDAEQLTALISPRNRRVSAEEAARGRQLAPGQGAVAYLCLAFDPGVSVPARLRHRVLLGGAYADGPAIGTRHARLRTLAPPVAGPDWIAAGGPGNTSHHRVGLLVIGGNARISRRYAIDWRQVRDGTTFAGDALDARSYHAYGEQVFAVADGTVIASNDGLPDNIPRTEQRFETALPLTMDNVAGNAVTLDLGDGQFALYAHLEPGSVLVKKGERVGRGQALGRIGNSGDSREPHLHFEVTDHPDLLAGEGLPYLIDWYDIRSQDAGLDRRINELPTLETPLNFRPAQSISD